MALNSFLKVTGNTQGAIEGECTQTGREGTMEIFEVDHTVTIPRHPQTGLPTGTRIHKPMEVVKQKDKSSPLLFQACCTGEQLTTEMTFWRINDAGVQEHYFTVSLEGAIIVEMQEYKANTLNPENEPYHDLERILFSYRKISWECVTGSTAAEDDWTVPTT
ncbi:Hcp family type VI secretion system effector [candidate division CSSED10-310 bacterium]|uniref:Hcp family type VI secretion system effector n=1 Tax=candidate division CSSED10-310 bacterium TaxID=2855610 RepID=A0ABV6Z1U6_UNCC1